MLPAVPFMALWQPATSADALRVPLLLLMVFGAAKLFGVLFEHLGQPGIVGQIIAGMVIGPQALNWVQPSAITHSLADMGVLFLLFRVGLEVKSSELLKVGGTALVVAILGVVVPFLFGWWAMLAFGYSRIESIFVGAAMVATSVGITAQVLSGKELLQERASKIILAAAVIDDVLGLLILAVVTSIAKDDGINWIGLSTTGAIAIAFTAIVATLGTRTAQRVVPTIEKRVSASDIQFDIAMIVLFALSVLAVKAGVAAIIGAFLGGMALSETLNERVHVLAHGISELLTPFFLVSIGLNMDFHAVANRKMLFVSLTIVAIAISSKLFGAGLGAIRLGWRDVVRVGTGMVPRGEVGMVVAQIGLAIHVVDSSIYGVVVVMTLATTMVAPPLLNWAYRDVRAPAGVEAQRENQYRIG